MTKRPFARLSGTATVGGCNPGTGWTNVAQLFTGYDAAISGDGMVASTATGLITAAESGIYLVTFTANTTPTAVAHVLTWTLQQNDSGGWVTVPGALVQHTTVAGVAFNVQLSALVQINATKSIRIVGTSSNAGPQDHVSDYFSFTAVKVA